MLSYRNDISVEDYCRLRSSVAWDPLPEEQARSGLEHSDFVISCRDGSDTVGCARVFWDKGYIAYLADVMVAPSHQGRGIGKTLVSRCIGYVDSQLKDGWRVKIVIVTSKGKEAFYEKLGFHIRPNEREGAGMNLWRAK